MGGKKKTTIGYKYKLGWHLIFCHGPIDKFTKLLADKKTAFVGNVTSSGSFAVNAENLFGGEEKEGGISGTFDACFGEPTQGQNAYLVNKIPGELIPAFRGLFGVVANSVYVGTTTYLKNIAARVQRIHKRTADGISQWYDAKAEIPGVESSYQPYPPDIADWKYKVLNPSDPLNSPTGDAELSSTTYDDSSWPIGMQAFGGGSYEPIADRPIDVNTLVLPQIGKAIWIRRTIPPLSPDWEYVVDFWHDDGGRIWFNGSEITSGIEEITYFHSRFAVPSGMLNSISNLVAVKVTDGVPSGSDIAIYAAMTITVRRVLQQVDMNPAHIIRECLTDPDWGMGYPDADIDDVSFMAAADTLYTEGMGMSILWNRSDTIEQFIDEIVKHIDAAVYVDTSTGKYTLKLIRNDYTVGSLLTLDESNVDKVENYTKPGLGELTNSVTVKYWDAATNTDRSITVQDIALVQVQQGVIPAVIEYPGFTNASIASRVAQRDLATLSTPIISCTLYANRVAKDLKIGSVFKFSWADLAISNLVMRVTGIAYGDGRSNKIRITCTQDSYSVPTAPIILPEEPILPDPNPYPVPAVYRMAYELPYLEAVQQTSQTQVDNSLLANNEIGYVGCAAVRPLQAAINADVYTAPVAAYDFVDKLDFCPMVKLDGAIGKLATVLTVKDGTEVENAIPGSWVQCGNEIMVFVSYVEPTLTVKRGALDTVPEEHADEALILFWDAYSAIDQQQYVEGESIDVKICPITGQGPLDLVNAPVDSVTMASRMIRPYAPGQFKINGSDYPTAFANVALTVSWVHRDRLLQTGSVYLGTMDPGVGPEPGTVYNVRFYNDSTNTLIHSETGISGTSSTPYSPVGSINIRVELEAERDGFVSYQMHKHVFAYSGSEVRITEESDTRITEDGNRRITE